MKGSTPRHFHPRSGPYAITLWLIALAVISILPSWGQTPQVVEARPQDTVAWHVVEPGDTLSTLTQKYLGISSLWRENHRLNPHIKDPNLLSIGSKIRIIIARETPATKAEVEKVVRDVRRRSADDPWEPAKEGDVLVEKNEVRTYKRASTRLRFDDGSNLNIKEESLIFLRKVGQTLRGIDRQTIEIVEGEADYAQQSQRKQRSDIEIIVGDVLAKPEPDASGLLATRTRRSEDGNAQVMVYDGNTLVDSAGSKVAVPKGMGTVVEQGKPPAPPSKLLAATPLNAPQDGSSLTFANPKFSWSPVPDAASYTLEFCGDPGCATPYFRQANITNTSYQSENLAGGTFYWRVTAVSQASLDGFPAKSRQLVITGNRPDMLAPVVVAYPVGAGSVVNSDQITLGPNGSVQIIAQDDASGIASFQFRWNDGAWQTYSGQPLSMPDGLTEAVLEAKATDNLDKASDVLTVRVTQSNNKPSSPFIKKDQ